MDLVKLEVAKQLFNTLGNYDGASFVNDEKFRHGLMDACADAADRLCSKMGDASGHPAETALEQLFDLLAMHDDKLLPKWVKAMAKHRELRELCAYLGAERVAESS